MDQAVNPDGFLRCLKCGHFPIVSYDSIGASYRAECIGGCQGAKVNSMSGPDMLHVPFSMADALPRLVMHWNRQAKTLGAQQSAPTEPD